MKLSVIICTHNPREVALRRTLDSLKAQSLNFDQWELMLVDNASDTPIDVGWSLAWHPNARIVAENELGLTPARLRGIHESTRETLCFVDDDNELDPFYLEAALHIANKMPFIGCWGGEIAGEYETTPPPWFRKYASMLAVRPLARDNWGNLYRYGDTVPCGAGMCVRRPVVAEYLRQCENSPIRKSLDRCGNSTASNGDVDLAFTAIDMGMGTGRFRSMRMTHLIPAQRLDPEYLKRLSYGMAKSNVYLDYCRQETRPNGHSKSGIMEAVKFKLRMLRLPKAERGILTARREGTAAALKEMLPND